MSQFIFIEEDKVQEYEEMAQELKFYKEVYHDLDILVNKLKDAFLGPDWYVTDPVRNFQANEIIIEEIIRKFAPKKKKKKKKS